VKGDVMIPDQLTHGNCACGTLHGNCASANSVLLIGWKPRLAAEQQQSFYAMPIGDSGKMKQYHPILSELCLVKSVYPATGRKCSLSSTSLHHTAQRKGSNPYTAGGIVGSSYVPENEEGPEMEIWKRIFF